MKLLFRKIRQFLFGWRYPYTKQVIPATQEACLVITETDQEIKIKYVFYRKIHAWAFRIDLYEGKRLEYLVPMIEPSDVGSLHMPEDFFDAPFGMEILNYFDPDEMKDYKINPSIYHGKNKTK